MRMVCNTNHILLMNLEKVKHRIREYKDKNHPEEASRPDWERRGKLPFSPKESNLRQPQRGLSKQTKTSNEAITLRRVFCNVWITVPNHFCTKADTSHHHHFINSRRRHRPNDSFNSVNLDCPSHSRHSPSTSPCFAHILTLYWRLHRAGVPKFTQEWHKTRDDSLILVCTSFFHMFTIPPYRNFWTTEDYIFPAPLAFRYGHVIEF